VSAAQGRDVRAANVAAYKTILRDILEERPSGTRQRLATALGKNRSFVSQMCNPAYPAPIPAPHLEIIFEICHFPPAQKRLFLESFERAHPDRIRQTRESPSLRSLKLEVYDFGSERKNRAFDELVRETTRRLAQLIGHDD
jgi:hypothetical protein